MKTEINNDLIRSLGSCYDPLDVNIPDGESLSVKEWIQKYRNTVKNKEDVIWLLCRPEFMSDRDCRLFAVWCAREALKLIPVPDQRSIDACNVAERFANGEANREELAAARAAAWAAESAASAASDARDARDAAWFAARSAAESAAARDAALFAARNAESAASGARDAASFAQIDQLLTYFN